MIVKFDKLFKNKDELSTIDMKDPFYVAACAVNIMCAYDPNYPDNFLEMLQVLMGDVQPITPYLKQNIKDRMTSNNKWLYIGKSYFKGAIPENDYTPSVPYDVEVSENSHSRDNPSLLKLFITNGGTSSPRPITLRMLKDGRWLLFSDTIVGMMTGIKEPESSNPWA